MGRLLLVLSMLLASEVAALEPSPSGSRDVSASGAPINFTGDATSQFQVALDDPAIRRVTFCGNYLIRSLVVPDGKRLEGCGMHQAVLRVGGQEVDAAITLKDGSALSGMTVNANRQASKGVSIVGEYIQVTSVLAQYARYCFHNSKGNVSILNGTSHQDCEFGFYSADAWVNSIIRDHIGRNGSPTSTGAYFTYSAQQPQAVRILASQFFGDRDAIVFAKDAFSVNIVDGVIDGATGNGIVFQSPPCGYAGAGDVYVRGMFISAAGDGIVVRAQAEGCPKPAPGYSHLVISGNDIANGKHGIVVSSTTESRAEAVAITDNMINNFSDVAVVLDSVADAWVTRNLFSLAGGSGAEIAVLGTYKRGPNPPVRIDTNAFRKSGPRVVGNR